MKNLFLSDLHNNDVEHCTTDLGLKLRRDIDKPFKKLCNIFTNVNIIRENKGIGLTDDEYFNSLPEGYHPVDSKLLVKGKNNIIVERYPELNPDEPYIFVCNHTCPEDIETVLNVIDRNAYLILGSIESLQYDPEMYLSFINGMLPFHITDPDQRILIFEKMKRVIKTNSILIFPEGSHNYSPKNLINPIFDGPVNLALQTNRKIVALTLIRDQENNISYLDVSNPIDVTKIDVDLNKEFESEEELEKYYVNSLSSYVRNKMANAVYHIISRRFLPLHREDYDDIEETLRQEKMDDSFKKMKWNKDIFEAEFLVKKTKAERDYEEVVTTLSNLSLDPRTVVGRMQNGWVLEKQNLDRTCVANRFRERLFSMQEEKAKTKRK